MDIRSKSVGLENQDISCDKSEHRDEVKFFNILT